MLYKPILTQKLLIKPKFDVTVNINQGYILSNKQQSPLLQKTLDIRENDAVIEFNFAVMISQNFIDYEVLDGLLYFNLKVPAFYNKSIYDNTLSLPGISFILDGEYGDEKDTAKIHELLKDSSLICKHVIDIPTNPLVKGVLLNDFIMYMGMPKVNKTKFGIKVELLYMDIIDKLNKEIMKDENEIPDSLFNGVYKPSDFEQEDNFLYETI